MTTPQASEPYPTALGTQLRATATNTIDADTRPEDGTARCAEEGGMGLRLTVCAWSGHDALLTFLTPGLTSEQAAQQMRTMLVAIVARK